MGLRWPPLVIGAVFLSLLLSACQILPNQNITVDDSAWYGSYQGDGAHQFYMFDDGQADLSEAQWQAIWRNPNEVMVATKISTLTDLTGIIEQACSSPKITCTQQAVRAKEDLLRFIRRANAHADRVNEFRQPKRK